MMIMVLLNVTFKWMDGLIDFYIRRYFANTELPSKQFIRNFLSGCTLILNRALIAQT